MGLYNLKSNSNYYFFLNNIYTTKMEEIMPFTTELNLSLTVAVFLRGIGGEGLRWSTSDNTFNVYGAKITRSVLGMHINGRGENYHISHQRFWGDNDIDYEFNVKPDLKVDNWFINNNTVKQGFGEWLNGFGGDISGPVAQITQNGFEYKIPDSDMSFLDIVSNPPTIESPVPGSEMFLEGSWEGDVTGFLINVLVYSAIAYHAHLTLGPNFGNLVTIKAVDPEIIGRLRAKLLKRKLGSSTTLGDRDTKIIDYTSEVVEGTPEKQT